MKNVHMCYIGVAEGKNENLKKEGKTGVCILIFIYTIHFAYPQVYTNFITLKQVVAEKTVTKNVHMCYIVLFDLFLYVPSTIFQLCRDGSSWVEPVLS